MIKSESDKLNQTNHMNIDTNYLRGGGGVGNGRSRKKWSGKGGGLFSRILLISYIFLYYPLKFGILFSISSIMYYILKQTYSYGCMAVSKFISFFSIILDPGDFDLILFSIPNIFNIFMAFLDLFIGIIYLGITLLWFIFLGLVTIPFNIVFALGAESIPDPEIISSI